MAILQFVARNRGSAGARSYDNSVSILQAEETGPPEIAALTQTNYRTHKPRGSSRIPDGYMRPNRFEALGRNFRQWPGNRRMQMNLKICWPCPGEDASNSSPRRLHLSCSTRLNYCRNNSCFERDGYYDDWSSQAHCLEDCIWSIVQAHCLYFLARLITAQKI